MKANPSPQSLSLASRFQAVLRVAHAQRGGCSFHATAGMRHPWTVAEVRECKHRPPPCRTPSHANFILENPLIGVVISSTWPSFARAFWRRFSSLCAAFRSLCWARAHTLSASRNLRLPFVRQGNRFLVSDGVDDDASFVFGKLGGEGYQLADGCIGHAEILVRSGAAVERGRSRGP